MSEGLMTVLTVVEILALVVVLAETYGEAVRDHRPAPRHDRGPVVALPLQRAGDLHRLHLGLEGAGERTVDDLLDTPLEPLQDAHRHLLEG